MTGQNPSSDKRLNAALITDAQSGTSRELMTRQKRYAITMAFRTLCFISLLFVSGALRWVLLGFAVFLPYIAVLFANQAHTRTQGSGPIPKAEPTPAPQITKDSTESDVIEGKTEDEEESAA